MSRTCFAPDASETRAASARRPGHAVRRAAQSVIERLEDRTLFAYNLTLSPELSFNVKGSTTGNVTTFMAAGSQASLAWSDINKELGVGHDVIVDTGSTGAEAGDIKDLQVGGISLKNANATSLTFQSGSGTNLVGNISLGTVNLLGGNSSIKIAAAGTISGGTVTSFTLALSAAGGIGSSKTPFLAQTSNLVAQTGTGGIFINNTGDLAIGFTGEPFAGVHVTGAKGDIQLTSAGAVSLTHNPDVIQGPGNVTVSATGATSDIQIALSDVTAGATATVTAGRDVLVSSGGNVAGGNVVVNAGRDMALGAGVLTAQHSGTLTAAVGRNISIGDNGGIESDNGAITLTTGVGGTLSESAGALLNSAVVTGGPGAPILISADGIVLPAIAPGTIAGIYADVSTVTIQPVTPTQKIDLGTKSPGNLGITDAELNSVTGTRVIIGNAADTGNIAVTAPITSFHPFLSLRTGGAIAQGGAGNITVSALALQAGAGIGTATAPLLTQVTSLSAQSGTGGIFISSSGDLAIGTNSGEPFSGVQVTGPSGDISLTSAGSITVDRFQDVVKTAGNITVRAASDVVLATDNPNGSLESDGGSSTVSIAAGRDVILGRSIGGVGDVESAGSIVLTAAQNIKLGTAHVDAHGAGTLTATAGGDISLLPGDPFSGALLTSEGGAISLTTGGTFVANSLSGVFSTKKGGNGPITISSDSMVISGGTSISAGSGTLTLQPVTPTRTIDLGTKSAGNLGLADAELAQMTAGTLVIGNTADTGNIQVTAPLTAHPGYATLSLRTGGAIVDDNATEPDITIAKLALRAGNGISLDTAATDVAFSNAAGAVSVRNTGALTIDAVDGLTASSNAGTTTTLSAASPITFAVNTTSAGTLSATTTETASETTTPLPPPDDNLAVNPGMTVQSSGGDVIFNAADGIVINNTAQVLASSGNVDLRSGTGDNDNDSAMSLNGTVAANAAGAAIRLVCAGAVSQGPAGVLATAGLSVAAAGNVTLNQSNNSVGTFAAAVSGSGSALSLSTTAGFTVGTVSGDAIAPSRAGISATGNVTLAPANGILTISQDISAAALTLSPAAGGVHQTAGTIIANSLIQSAGSILSIYGGSIFTSAGGMQLNGTDFSVSGPINLNSGPLVMSDTGAATVSGVISGSAGLVMNGPGTLTLTAANTYAAPTTIIGGTLIIAAAGALPAVQSVANNGVLHINADSSPGEITGDGTLTVKSATVILPTFSQGAVAIQSAGTLKLQSASATTSTTSSLAIDAGSRLDMTTNSLRITYGAAPDPVATIRAYLASGYNAGAWTGSGISTSAGNASHALGLGDAADGTVAGLAPNSLLIRYTRYGDVNLDGAVGFADLVALARHYGQSNVNWDQGDMNYDGVVGFADLVALARNYGASAAARPTLALSPAVLPELRLRYRRHFDISVEDL